MTSGRDERLLNQRQIAEIMGVSTETIRNWVSSGCPTRPGSGGVKLYLPSEVIAWREDRIKRAALDSVELTDVEEAKRRKLAAEASMAEIDLATKRGDVANITVIADEVGSALASCRARLIGVGSAVAPRLSIAANAAEMRAIVDEAIYAALEEISDGVLGFAGRSGGAGPGGDIGEDGGDDEAAAGADGQRVG